MKKTILSRKTKRNYKIYMAAMAAGLLTACSPAEKLQAESPAVTAASVHVQETETTEAGSSRARESVESTQPESMTDGVTEADAEIVPKIQGTETTEPVQADEPVSGGEFNAENAYVIGNPILSDFLFLKANMADIKNIEDNLTQHSGEEYTDGGYFIYQAGEGITYVTYSDMNDDLYAVILTTDQFQLGCGLKVGMKEEEIASLTLPFVSYSREDYPIDSRFVNDMSCPIQTLDYDAIYLYQSGPIPEDALKSDSVIAGGRLSITALVKDGVVICVFTDIQAPGR